MSAHVEPGVMQPQTKECRQPPGVGRDKNSFSHSTSGGIVAPLNLILAP